MNAQNEAIKRADRIICISQSTQNDLAHFHPNEVAKSVVIPLGSSLGAGLLKPGYPKQSNPTFLYVGARTGYKNFNFLLRSFAKARSKMPSIRLHVAGPPLTDDERWTIYYLRLDGNIDHTVYPSEHDLVNLYKSSSALVYPSIYEGFGLPPLEAMECGTLAITSNATSLPEVVGDAGILLDPYKEDEWADTLIQVASGKVDFSGYLKRGYERVKQFSWAKAVSSYVDVYRELAP